MTMPDKKEDRRVRRTRKILTQALTELMQTKQINEISVKELTDLADMNRGTFYLYYKDIYDMLEKIEDSLFEKLNDIVALRDHEDVAAQTRSILPDLFRFIEENQEMCRVLLSANGDMNFLHRLNEVVREKCRNVWLTLRKGRDDDAFDYHYSFVVFGCAGLIRAWVNRGCPETAAEMAELADCMIQRGSLTDME